VAHKCILADSTLFPESRIRSGTPRESRLIATSWRKSRSDELLENCHGYR